MDICINNYYYYYYYYYCEAKFEEVECAGHTVCRDEIKNKLFSKMKGTEY